jgi:DNA-binding NarL/FixJ family response regulator
LYLSDLNGIELARRALEILPKLKIIILAERISLSEIQEALSSGVLGFLFKQTIPEHFIEAIDLVGKGQRYLAREATSLVLEDYKRLLETANAPGKSPLSLREQEVWRLISEGKRNKDIAGLMDVGETTVETYRRRLMTKLGCGSTADLIRKALLNRIGRP